MNAFDSDGRGTLQSESGGYFDNKITYSNTTKKEDIPADLYLLICDKDRDAVPSRQALFQSSITYGRATYSTKPTSENNSYVVFGDYPTGKWYPAQIISIMIQSLGGNADGFYTHVAVRCFEPLKNEDVSRDFYLAQRRSGSLGDIGHLFYKRKSKQTILLDVSDIVCHFACNPVQVPGITRSCIHVRPCFRVSRKAIITHHIHQNKLNDIAQKGPHKGPK